jgi:hypothetical protein
MITTDRLTDLLRRHWDRLGAGGPSPSRLSFLLLTKGREPVGKVVFLAFAHAERTPRVVIKLARLKAQNAALDAESRNLDLVAPYGTWGRVVIPRVLLHVEAHGQPVLIESVIDGVALDEGRIRRVDVLAAIVDWLIHIGQTTGHLPPDGGARETPSALLLHAAARAITDEERRLLDRVSRRLLPLQRQPPPHVFEQRDMAPWNLMAAAGGTIGILDWESSRPRGFPAWDLFYFLAHYGFMRDRALTPGRRLASFQDTFFRPEGFGATARSAVRRYTDALGLRDEWLIPLFLGCWLHHTLSEVSRLGFRLSDSLFWRMLAATFEPDARPNFLESRHA